VTSRQYPIFFSFSEDIGLPTIVVGEYHYYQFKTWLWCRLYEPEIWRWLCAPNPACRILVFCAFHRLAVSLFMFYPVARSRKKKPILHRKGNQATLELNGNLDMFDCTYMQLHSYSWLFLWVRAAPVFLQTEPWFLAGRSINKPRALQIEAREKREKSDLLNRGRGE